MAVFETWLNQDLQKPLKPQVLDGSLFTQDNAGNLVGVVLFNNGEPEEIFGTVGGMILRADGATVAVADGNSSGNKGWIVLPQSAYAVPGQIVIVIKVTNGSTVTTIGAATVCVQKSSTDTIVDPGTIISGIDTLIATIDAAVDSIPADYSALLASIAPNYANLTFPVKKGQPTWYSGTLYMAKQDIAAAESWTASHWQASAVSDAIMAVEGDVSELKSALYITAEITPIDGKYISINGSIESVELFEITEPIPIYQNRMYVKGRVNVASGSYFLNFYTGLPIGASTFISGYNPTQVNVTIPYTLIDVPQNAQYLVVSTHKQDAPLSGVEIAYANTLVKGNVRFDIDQTLTDAQQTRARANIGGASETDLNSLKSALYITAEITPIDGKYINANGSIESSELFEITEPIPIYQNQMYVKGHVNVASGSYFLNFYTGLPIGASTFISGYNPTQANITIPYTLINVPQSAQYLVVSTHKQDAPLSGVEIAYANTLVKKESYFVNILPSSKIVLLGDSITAGQGATDYVSWTETDGGTTKIIRGNGPNYPDAGPDYQVGELLLNIANYYWYESLSAKGFANLFKEYIEQKFSCTVKNKGCAGISTSELLANYQSWADGFDVVFIMIGTNDRHNTDYNVYKQRLSTIVGTLLGAGKSVYLLSSLPASLTNEADPSRLYHMEDVDNAVEEVAGTYGIKHISFYREVMKYCDYRNVSVDTLLADGLHPNDLGYKLMLRILLNELGVGLKLGEYTLT